MWSGLYFLTKINFVLLVLQYEDNFSWFQVQNCTNCMPCLLTVIVYITCNNDNYLLKVQALVKMAVTVCQCMQVVLGIYIQCNFSDYNNRLNPCKNQAELQHSSHSITNNNSGGKVLST